MTKEQEQTRLKKVFDLLAACGSGEAKFKIWMNFKTLEFRLIDDEQKRPAM